MKKYMLITSLTLSLNSFAFGGGECHVGMFNSTSQTRKNVTVTLREGTTQFIQGVLVGTVQFAHDRIIQIMVEDKKNYIFTSTQLSDLEKTNFSDSIMLQNIKSGDTLSLDCKTH